MKPYSLDVIYVGLVACKAGRSCLSPGLCFSSAWRINRVTPGPLTQLQGEWDARVNDTSQRTCWGLLVNVCTVYRSLLIKEEMSTCSLKHLVLSFCCYHSEAVRGENTITHAHMCVLWLFWFCLRQNRVFYWRLVEKRERLKDWSALMCAFTNVFKVWRVLKWANFLVPLSRSESGVNEAYLLVITVITLLLVR